MYSSGYIYIRIYLAEGVTGGDRLADMQQKHREKEKEKRKYLSEGVTGGDRVADMQQHLLCFFLATALRHSLQKKK